MFEELYTIRATTLKSIFKEKYVGPNTLPAKKDVLIARFEKIPQSDGYPVEVYVCAMPALFYKITALTSENSVNETKKGFVLSMGTIPDEMAYTLADLINQGMMSCKLLEG